MGSLEIRGIGGQSQVSPPAARGTIVSNVKVWIAIGAALAVLAISVGLAVALPGAEVFPDGPTSSPTPSLTTENWLNPAFPWRAGVIILAAVVVMAAIALVARALDRRRSR